MSSGGVEREEEVTAKKSKVISSVQRGATSTLLIAEPSVPNLGQQIFKARTRKGSNITCSNSPGK